MPLDENENPPPGDAATLSTGPRAFAPGQMVTCEVCLRANPPTRTACLYCVAQLPAVETGPDMRKPTLRKLEEWERGFNVILLTGEGAALTEEACAEVASLVRLDPEELKRVVEAGVPMPLARAATMDEAALVERGLAAACVRALVLGDGELAPDPASMRRARSLEFKEDALVAYTAGGGAAWRVAWSEIRLLVTGRLLTRQIEIEERKGRSAEAELVDAREISTDWQALDIYTGDPGDCLRVVSGNFDFSCLGARKGLLTAQNFHTLTELLRERAPSAVFDDSYNRVRRALAAWPISQHTEPRGLRRERPGRVNTEAVTTSDNEMQFTRYSRLRHYLSLNPPETNE